MDARGVFYSRHQRGSENAAKPLPPTYDELQLGGIIARVNLTNIVEHWEDDHAFALPIKSARVCINCGVEHEAASWSSQRCAKPNRWQMDTSVGLVLKDTEPLPFVPWKGALGLFHVDASEYDAALAEAMMRGHVGSQP
jgi:hypothetical protein